MYSLYVAQNLTKVALPARAANSVAECEGYMVHPVTCKGHSAVPYLATTWLGRRTRGGVLTPAVIEDMDTRTKWGSYWKVLESYPAML